MKNFKPSKELLKASELCFIAMTITETVRPIVEGYQKEILNRNKFRTDPKHKEGARGIDFIIVEPKHSYLMSDKDSKIYFKELDEAVIKNGLTVDKKGFCPLLVAESNERDAKRELLKAAEYITKIDTSKIYKLDILRKMEELTLKLCAPFIDSKKALNQLNINL